MLEGRIAVCRQTYSLNLGRALEAQNLVAAGRGAFTYKCIGMKYPHDAVYSLYVASLRELAGTPCLIDLSPFPSEEQYLAELQCKCNGENQCLATKESMEAAAFGESAVETALR